MSASRTKTNICVTIIVLLRESVVRADCARNGSNGNMARRWKHAAAVRVSGLQATTSNLPLPIVITLSAIDARGFVIYFFSPLPHRSPPSKSFRSIVGMACTSVAAAACGHRPMRRSRRRRRRLFTRHTTRNVNVCVCVCVSARACVGIRLRGPPNPPRRRRLLRVSVMRQCKPSAKGSRRRRVVGVSPMGGRPKPDDGGDRGAHRGSRRCR